MLDYTRLDNSIIENEEALKLCDEARAVIKEFDGKIFNVRFKRALEAVGLNFYDGFIMCGSIHLVGNHQLQENGFVINKRIQGEAWLVALTERETKIKKYIEQMKDDRLHGFEKIEKLNKLAADYTALRMSITRDARECFGSALRTPFF